MNPRRPIDSQKPIALPQKHTIGALARLSRANPLGLAAVYDTNL